MIYSKFKSLRSIRPISSLLLASVALGAAPIIAAQDGGETGVYVNIGGAFLTADLDLSDIEVQGNNLNLGEEDADLFMINGRLGYRIHKFFAVEAEGGFGIGGDSIQRSVPVPVDLLGTVNVDVDADIDVSDYIVGMARAILPVNDRFDLFVRGGYGSASGEVDGVGTTDLLGGITVTASESDNIDGFAYGIGAEYYLNENSGIRIDGSAIGSDAQFVSIAYSYRF